MQNRALQKYTKPIRQFGKRLQRNPVILTIVKESALFAVRRLLDLGWSLLV
jgi:hypothetical protein